MIVGPDILLELVDGALVLEERRGEVTLRLRALLDDRDIAVRLEPTEMERLAAVLIAAADRGQEGSGLREPTDLAPIIPLRPRPRDPDGGAE